MAFLRRTRREEATLVGSDCTPLGQLHARVRAKVSGQVVRMRARPARGLPSLEVVLDDGTGRAVAVWSGRRSIGGITLGRHLLLEGVAVDSESGLTFLNPAYELLSSGH
ncbi:MAG: hypothetical protein RL391_219 [Actinomycetota bacterium]|jgi:hypothetical protein